VNEDFDPELYLRLAGESEVLERGEQGRAPWDSPLHETAAALVAIGALESDVAQKIVDDYELALSLRARHGGRHFFARQLATFRHRSPTNRFCDVLRTARIVPCNQEFEESWGKVTVHFVLLGDTSASVMVSAHEVTPGALTSNFPQMTQQLAISDDTGRREIAHLSGGGGSEGNYQAVLTTQGPLSKSAQWIDIRANRVVLEDDPDAPQVVVEPMPESDPAVRHLWSRVVQGRHPIVRAPETIEIAIRTLVAAGALSADNNAIQAVRAVLAANSGQGVGFSGPISGVGPPSAPGASQTNPKLPKPWASLLAARANLLSGSGGATGSGPCGNVGLGVLTPPVDGVTIGLGALSSSSDSFDLLVVVSPDFSVHGGHFGASAPVGSPTIAWWAEDDRGNHYVGSVGRWAGNGDLGQGTVTFLPALDPASKELRILPSCTTERAVVTLKLPDWDEPRTVADPESG